MDRRRPLARSGLKRAASSPAARLPPSQLPACPPRKSALRVSTCCSSRSTRFASGTSASAGNMRVPLAITDAVTPSDADPPWAAERRASVTSEPAPFSLDLSHARPWTATVRPVVTAHFRGPDLPEVPSGTMPQGPPVPRAAHKVGDVGGVHGQQRDSRAFYCRFRCSESRGPDLRESCLRFGQDAYDRGPYARESPWVGIGDARCGRPDDQHCRRAAGGLDQLDSECVAAWGDLACG